MEYKVSCNQIIFYMRYFCCSGFYIKGGLYLDTQRAKQIIESKGVIEVLYGDCPVWIESLNGDVANITYMQTKNKDQVPVDKLYERKNNINTFIN
mgnify:FL=1